MSKSTMFTFIGVTSLTALLCSIKIVKKLKSLHDTYLKIEIVNWMLAQHNNVLDCQVNLRDQHIEALIQLLRSCADDAPEEEIETYNNRIQFLELIEREFKVFDRVEE